MFPLPPSILPLVYWPDETLSTSSTRMWVENCCKHRQLADDLLTTMDHHNGYGLAAPQVGHNLNMFVIRVHKPRLFCNVDIEVINDTPFKHQEGCLSVPGYYNDRKRPNNIRVFFKDMDGTDRIEDFEGLEAFVIQHEFDHIKGKVFVDELSPFKQKRIKAKVRKNIR